MKLLNIHLLITVFIIVIMNISEAQIVENDGFEAPKEIGIYPSTHAELGEKILHWKDDKPELQNFHSPDWYYVDAYFMEEILPGDVNYTPVYGNNNSNGYVGMRSCELIKQKLSQKLVKDEYYAISFYIRFLHDDNRVHQEIDRSFLNSETFEIKIELTDDDVNYKYPAIQCIEEVCNEIEYIGAPFNKKQTIFIKNINKQKYPPGEWHRITEVIKCSKKDLEYVHIDLKQNPQIENCGNYLLIDDFQIHSGCEETESDCAFNQGFISPISCNKNHTASILAQLTVVAHFEKRISS